MNDTPAIPVGLATKIGQMVGAGFAVVAAITAVIGGDVTEETVTAMILSGVTFITMMGGRYFQAGMLYRHLGPAASLPPPPPMPPSEPAETV